jgi:CBS domain-containing protein
MDEIERPSHVAMRIGAIMTPYPLVIGVDTTLDEVAEVFAQNGISGAPVVDGHGRMVGVVSQTDLVRAAAAGSAHHHAFDGYTARHVMTHQPVTARADLPLPDAVRRLEEHGVHRLVIVGDDGTTPIGIVSVSDLLPLLEDAADR